MGLARRPKQRARIVERAGVHGVVRAVGNDAETGETPRGGAGMTPAELYTDAEQTGDEDADDVWVCDGCGGEASWADDEPRRDAYDDEQFCESCWQKREDDDRDCPDCRGTGIGHGPPDVSRCMCCRGSGVRKQERDPDDWADEKRDREWDDRNEPRPAVDRGVDW